MPAKRGRPRRPATTEEGREGQLVSLAMDLAEKQMIEGTASAQVITHYLKLGSPREQLERQRMDYENRLLEARAEQIASQGRMEELYTKALQAMSGYSGQTAPELAAEEETYDEY